MERPEDDVVHASGDQRPHGCAGCQEESAPIGRRTPLAQVIDHGFSHRACQRDLHGAATFGSLETDLHGPPVEIVYSEVNHLTGAYPVCDQD